MLKQRQVVGVAVHMAHFKDGYPLCWPMDRDGSFKATHAEADVTCRDCLGLLAE